MRILWNSPWASIARTVPGHDDLRIGRKRTFQDSVVRLVGQDRE